MLTPNRTDNFLENPLDPSPPPSLSFFCKFCIIDHVAAAPAPLAYLSRNARPPSLLSRRLRSEIVLTQQNPKTVENKCTKSIEGGKGGGLKIVYLDGPKEQFCMYGGPPPYNF